MAAPLRVLHVLAPGGDAGRLVELLHRLPDAEHARFEIGSHNRAPLPTPALVARRLQMGRAAARADVVHVHGDGAAAVAAGGLRGRHAVWSTHGLELLRASEGGVRATLVRRLRAACEHALVAAASSADAAELARAGVCENATVVPYGVDLPPATTPQERAEARAALGLADLEGTVILFHGDLDERSGVVAAAMAARRVQATLLVAGDGPLRAELQADPSRHVRLLGHRDDLATLRAAAGMFVAPGERSASFSVLEAMASGLAVVVSDAPGHAEVVGDGGIVVPSGNVDRLAAVVSRLHHDPIGRAAFGVAARHRVETSFTVQRLLDDVAAAYARARGAAAPPAAGLPLSR